MTVKIQINSLEAVERLIGDSDTMEIEVRRSVIESFANTFVKKIGNNDELVSRVERIKNEINNSAILYVKNELGIPVEYGELSSNAKIRIREQVYEQITNLVEEIVKREIRNIDDKINNAINYHIDTIVRQKIEKYNQERIKDIIEKVLEEL
jgi:hypothetical protein